MSDPQEVTIGPYVNEDDAPPGDCPDCGGQCDPECGMHPRGCVYGGFSRGYWLIAEGCDLWHGAWSA
jgi:hypothetical protein